MKMLIEGHEFRELLSENYFVTAFSFGILFDETPAPALAVHVFETFSSLASLSEHTV